jgi:transposase
MWTPTTRWQYRRGGLRYESDLTDMEWRLIEPWMPLRCHSWLAAKVAVARDRQCHFLLPAPLVHFRIGEHAGLLKRANESLGCPWHVLPIDFTLGVRA